MNVTIPKKLRKEETYNLHVEMWNDIAENRHRFKQNSSILHGKSICNDCFLCDSFYDEETNCFKCPAKRYGSFYASSENGFAPCEQAQSPFSKWCLVTGEIFITKDSAKIKRLEALARKWAIEVADWCTLT